MKTLVTGATGRIGQAVVAQLLAEGHDVAIATRRPFLAERLFDDKITIHEWHPVSERLPAAMVADRDSVLSLMGAPIAGGLVRGRETLACASRKTAMSRIADATAGRDVRIVVASLAIAPPGRGEPLREADAIGQAPHLPAARLVAEWEAGAFAAHAEGGRVAIVRLGLVAAESCVLRELVRLARMGLVPRLGGAMIPSISLGDVATTLVGILRHPQLGGLVHGVAPTPVAGEALMAALRSIAPVSRPLVVPLPLLRRQLGLAAALLGCQRQIVPDVLVQNGATFAAADPTESLARVISDMGAGATAHAPLAPPPAPHSRRGDAPATSITPQP